MAGQRGAYHLFLSAAAARFQGGTIAGRVATRRGSHPPGRGPGEKSTGTGSRNGGRPSRRGGRRCPAPGPAASGPHCVREAGLRAPADLLPACPASAAAAPARPAPRQATPRPFTLTCLCCLVFWVAFFLVVLFVFCFVFVC